MAGPFRDALDLRAGSRALLSPRAVVWSIVGLAALAFGLRWACIHQSLFGDELYLYTDVHGRSLGQVFSAIHANEKTPPLYFVLGWLLARGSSAAVLVRVPSLVASVASVPLIYVLGLRTLGRGAGVVAAAWFALSPFAIFYGTEARGYALVAALVVLSTVALLAALDDRRLRWWALYALAATAAMYTHYIAALSLVPQAAWALWAHRESAREQLIAHAVVILAFLPWLPSFIVQARHSAGEAKELSEEVPLTLSTLRQISIKSLDGHPFLALRDIPGRAPLAFLAALLLGLVLALGYGARRRRGSPRRALASRGGLVVLLAVAPFVGLVLYSLQPDASFLLARNLSCAAPYALLLFGWLLTRPPPRLAAVLSVAGLAAVGVGTVKALSPNRQRPDARDAARYIEAHGPPAAPVVEVLYPFVGPPSHPVTVYLEPQRSYADLNSAFAAGTRTRSPVFIVSPTRGIFARLKPPVQYASQYRLAGVHRSRGFIPLLTSEWAPR